MTTRIHVDAHAGWDVEVIVENTTSEGEVLSSTTEIVPKNTVKDFYIHSNMQIASVKEVKQGG